MSFLHVAQLYILIFVRFYKYRGVSMSFWERFYNLCIEKNEKPNPLGAKLGISSGSITRWKNGGIPNSKTLESIADYFNVTTDYLLCKTNIKKEQTAELQSDNEEINKLIEIGTKLSPEHLQALLVLAEELEKGQSE